ncbi:hypothetical protein CPB83DRAFT_900928, partial [Crepidotus variabilis]
MDVDELAGSLQLEPDIPRAKRGLGPHLHDEQLQNLLPSTKRVKLTVETLLPSNKAPRVLSAISGIVHAKSFARRKSARIEAMKKNKVKKQLENQVLLGQIINTGRTSLLAGSTQPISLAPSTEVPVLMTTTSTTLPRQFSGQNVHRSKPRGVIHSPYSRFAIKSTSAHKKHLVTQARIPDSKAKAATTFRVITHNYTGTTGGLGGPSALSTGDAYSKLQHQASSDMDSTHSQPPEIVNPLAYERHLDHPLGLSTYLGMKFDVKRQTASDVDTPPSQIRCLQVPGETIFEEAHNDSESSWVMDAIASPPPTSTFKGPSTYAEHVSASHSSPELQLNADPTASNVNATLFQPNSSGGQSTSKQCIGDTVFPLDSKGDEHSFSLDEDAIRPQAIANEAP